MIRILTSHWFWLILHAIGFVVFAALLYPSMTAWKDSVPFLVFISMYAILVAHLDGLTIAIRGLLEDKS